MKLLHSSQSKPILLAFVALATVGLLFALSGSARQTLGSTISSLIAHSMKIPKEPFPEITDASLTPIQIKIIALSKQEYEKSPVSFDSTVLKYTEGQKEPWCADYVSWLLNESGAPLSNPNSGHWRIPGVLTLQEYFKNKDAYKKANEYTPKTGDVAIYIGSKTLDGRSRQHANIVLKTEGDIMTTIGGNERGRLRLSTQKFKSNENSLVGFGVL